MKAHEWYNLIMTECRKLAAANAKRVTVYATDGVIVCEPDWPSYDGRNVLAHIHTSRIWPDIDPAIARLVKVAVVDAQQRGALA